MIYFDNSATGGFKPHSVIDLATTTIRYLSANPGRSAHRLSVAGMQTIVNTRTAFAEYFSCSSDRVIFTKNCTEALNTAIFGVEKRGKRIITTIYEHNSVLRPLTELQNNHGYILDIVSPSSDQDIVDAISNKICKDTCLIVTTAVSNVTGEILPFAKIGKLAKAHNIPYILDGAQAGGHIPINVKDDNVSAVCLAGHKGLYGVMGSGVLVISENLDINPLILGGTGSESFSPVQPLFYPERIESGTLNLPAIACLKEGVLYAYKNMQSFGELLFERTKTIIDAFSKIKNVECFSKANHVGIVSFRLKNMPSNQVADILDSNYDIAVRSGLHCAPLMHKYLGSDEDGLVRVSMCAQNSAYEVDYFISAVKTLSSR